ncbi:transporter [Brevibacterium sp. 5221]|uniref:Transporter n=1 Tax=Brevibacterium rongguiense TaxID=2695267 RepID=A0A6N9H5E3_9MICO|nr:monovalent cation/H+ antiporter complex subunit F [Brevibacterium rongguiense]MYM19139.1 transporter [Brevibacterium rongguiense]
MIIIVWVCILLLAAAIVLGIVRAVTAKDSGSRAVVGDLVYFSAIGILTLIAMLGGLSIMLDVIFLSSLLGILSTVALSRILTRGHR